MNRRSRTILVLVVAVLMAGAASFVVYRAIQKIPVRQVEVANYHVVVAAKPLSMGTRLRAEDVKLVAWPSSSPVANGYDDVKAVIDRGLLSSVVENEPLTDSKLASLESGAGLPPTIPQGMRAMSVKVNEVVGVAGFIVPGSKVDLMVTLRRDDDSMTRTVASNVQVLTAGTAYDREKAKDGQPIPSTVVTLMVSPEDAERITLAQSQGQIMLSLRNPLDTGDAETTGVRTGSLFGGAPPANPAPAPKPTVRRAAVAPRGPQIEVVPVSLKTTTTVESIKGGKRATEEIKGGGF
jgi:pilus assembly protein CpaB